MLEILEYCIVFLNERIYISALCRRHKCAIQVSVVQVQVCYTSKAVGPKAQNITQYTLTVPLKLKVDVRPA